MVSRGECGHALTRETPKLAPRRSSFPNTPSPIQPVFFADGRYQVENSPHTLIMFQEE